MNKVRANALEALRGIRDGATIAAGGFGLCGIPELSIQALRELGVGLTFSRGKRRPMIGLDSRLAVLRELVAHGVYTSSRSPGLATRV